MKTWGYMVLLFSICILGGCKDTEAETVQGKIVKAESSEQLLMVNGQLYYNTKKTDNESLRCGMMDGENRQHGRADRNTVKRIINPTSLPVSAIR